MTVFDAVIIGAGHNGLVAANLLADAGWDVVVLEAAKSPGGSVRSGEVAAPGFQADLCSAFYPFAACSPIFASLGLHQYGLRWRHAPTILAHALPDGRAVTLSRDPERTAASVSEFATVDGERWWDTYEQWRCVAKPVLDVLRTVRKFTLSARDLGEELFAGEGARVLLTGCAMHSDVSPEGTGSGAYGWLLTMIGQQYGFPAPEGGAQSITDALVRRLAARGGQVICGTPVERVVVGHGRALGVVDANGRPWRARRAVLADIPAPLLYLDLVGAKHLPPRMVADLANFRYGRPTVKIDWALDGPVPWTNTDISSAGTVHLGGDTADLTRSTAALAVGDDPAMPFVLAGQMSTVDPTRSPPGTETLWAYTHLPARYAGLDRNHDNIASYVERVEQMITECAPGFTQLVRGRYVQGPADLERENPALVGGTVGAGTSSPGQQLFFRPVPGLGRADTPIDRLYLAGASAHPGPGAPVTGKIYRAAIDAGHRLIY